MKKLLLAALAPVAALPLALGAGAGAATPWQTFGSGSAVGRGHYTVPDMVPPTQYSAANVEVGSSTKAHPVKVRVILNDGTYTGKATVETILYCHLKNGNTWNNTNSGWVEYSLPKTLTFTPPATVNYCDVRVEGFLSGNGGPFTVTLQAQYP
jgi:hypothetical protein